jgi:hypothetical protein
LLIAGLVVGGHWHFARLPDRVARADNVSPVTYASVRLPSQAGALRIAGAWRLTSREPRLGGVSALAVDRGALLALTDSGVVIRLPKPNGPRVTASFRDLPAGPGPARFKAARDSEALAFDRSGRGWWVAFESRHSLWWYDAGFARGEQRTRLDRLGWRANQGGEGMVADADGVTIFPESGVEMVRVKQSGMKRIALDPRYGRLADAAALPDGRTILLARTFGPLGFSAKLLLLDGNGLSPITAIRLGRLDNPEAIAAEALPGGTIRIWLMTDNDFRRRVPTLLVALDWPA